MDVTAAADGQLGGQSTAAAAHARGQCAGSEGAGATAVTTTGMEAADEDCIVKASSVCACCGLVVSTFCRPAANPSVLLVAYSSNSDRESLWPCIGVAMSTSSRLACVVAKSQAPETTDIPDCPLTPPPPPVCHAFQGASHIPAVSTKKCSSLLI
jgi:hypothetical protein